VPGVSYPPPGYGPPGYPPPPGYGPYPGHGGPRSNALAYVTAILFVVCGGLALLVAIFGWNGTSDNPDMIVALIGLALKDDLSGNADFAISITMSVACTAITFGLVLFARLEFVRWILGVLGGLVTLYYLYAIIKLLSDGGGEYIAVVLLSWLLWLAATVLVALPHTGRTMRRKQPTGFPPAYPQGYPHGYPQAGHYPPRH
jgi:hypothetical protein